MTGDPLHDSHGMTPTPTPEAVAAGQPSPVALGVLHDGEEIILLVRPSGWMVVLDSLPTAAVAAVVATATLLFEPRAMHGPRSIGSAVVLACALVVVLRVVVMFLRWTGRLYMLTNRRVLRLSGVASVDVAECPLKRITNVSVIAASAERVVGIGSLLFTIDGQLSNALGWTNIARPGDVAEEVRLAIRRHHHGNGK
jgi:uncharacterized membrane protein YdbT with pleckstrin-like domain